MGRRSPCGAGGLQLALSAWPLALPSLRYRPFSWSWQGPNQDQQLWATAQSDTGKLSNEAKLEALLPGQATLHFSAPPPPAWLPSCQCLKGGV